MNFESRAALLVGLGFASVVFACETIDSNVGEMDATGGAGKGGTSSGAGAGEDGTGGRNTAGVGGSALAGSGGRGGGGTSSGTGGLGASGAAGEESSGAAGQDTGGDAGQGFAGASGGGGDPNATGGAPGSGGTGGGDTCGSPYMRPIASAPITIATPAVPATECSPGGVSLGELPDECACEGLTCEGSATCVLVNHPPPSALGGPGFTFNGCFELCEPDVGCTSGVACVKNLFGLSVCATPECSTDADCDAGLCGDCIEGLYIGHGGAAYRDPSVSFCAYEGLCADDSCTGQCFDLTDDQGQHHRCLPEGSD